MFGIKITPIVWKYFTHLELSSINTKGVTFNTVVFAVYMIITKYNWIQLTIWNSRFFYFFFLFLFFIFIFFCQKCWNSRFLSVLFRNFRFFFKSKALQIPDFFFYQTCFGIPSFFVGKNTFSVGSGIAPYESTK